MSFEILLIIFAIIIFLIIPSFKDRVMPVKKLILIPAVFLYLLYQTVTDNFFLTFTSQLLIVLGIIVGTGVGILMRWKANVKADKSQRLIWLPGSYTPLITFALIFSVHFIIGYIKSVNPTYLTQITNNEQLLLFVLACVSSITVGTSICLFYKYTQCESTQLEFADRRGLFGR